MKEYERAARAATSYAFNKDLLPKVQERLEKAEAVLESYLSLQGQERVRVGRFEIERVDEGIRIEPVDDGWRQEEIDWRYEKVHAGATPHNQ